MSTEPISNNKILDLPSVKSSENVLKELKFAHQHASGSDISTPSLLLQEVIKSRTMESQETINQGYSMSYVTESLLDAKLQAAEARTEARIAHIEAMVESARDDAKSIKYGLWGIGIAVVGIVIAGYFSIAQLNHSLIQNMSSSFSLGQSSKDNIRTEVSAQNQALTEKTNSIEAKVSGIEQKLDSLIEIINK